ncbi:MAG: HEAT repeat domain-containing protein [Myxococcales bacterium]|nr:HEAT repeat domain-containing protein [Myxococcales bacterium]
MAGPGLTLLLLAAASWAGEKRDAVLELLGAFEEPVAQKNLEALGEGVDVELMAIADDHAVPHSRRGNAVVALQFYPTDPVHTFLVAHLAPGNDALLRRKAAHSLAAFGAAAVPELAPSLADDDTQVRIAVVHALGRIEDPTARTALESRLPQEPEPAVKDAIAKALGAGTP